jgi:uncharacterized membrane protein
MCGMFLVSAKSLSSLTHIRWERGVKFAVVSIIFMGGTNFLTGFGARLVTPLFVAWVSYVGLCVSTAEILLFKGSMQKVLKTSSRHLPLVLALGISDIIAWTSFARSTTYLPIGLVTAITESYIVLAVVLGVYENKERLRVHQYAGIGVIVLCVISLALIS